MRIIEGLVQGSPEWKALRAKYPCASEAPVVMGASRHMTRGEMLRLKAAGMEKEFSDYVQRMVLDKGHEVEDPARGITERQIGEALFPATAVSDDDEYLASLDGITMIEDRIMEHKQWSEELAAAIRAGATEFPDGQEWQMEQQLLVAESAECVIFVCSNGTEERRVQMEYRRVPGRAEQLKAGWRQFHADLAAGVAPPAPPKAIAPQMETLPVVSVRMEGALRVVSNLDVLAPALRAYIARIPAKPSNDEEFAHAEAACKALKKVEEALDSQEESALASLESFETMRRLKAELHKLARDTRLQREKMVDARKLEIRTEEVTRGKRALSECIDAHNAAIGKPYMPQIPADFVARIKGLRTVQSVRDAIDQELARAKIAAGDIANTIQTNLRTLRELAAAHAFLFADTPQLALKAPDDCRAVVTSRIAEHQAAEEKRLEAQREAIRAEEKAKAEKAARDQLAAEQAARDLQARRDAEAERQRVAAEQEAARQDELRREQEASEAAKPAQPPAAAPVASPASVSQALNVVPLGTRAPAAPESTVTIRLGQINDWLSPIHITAAGLQRLGFEPCGKDGAAVLFWESKFPAMCDSIVAHIRTAAEQAKQQRAA